MPEITDHVREGIRTQADAFLHDEAEMEQGIRDFAAIESMAQTTGWAVVEQIIRRQVQGVLATLCSEMDGTKIRVAQGTSRALKTLLALPAIATEKKEALLTALEDKRAERSAWVEEGGGC